MRRFWSLISVKQNSEHVTRVDTLGAVRASITFPPDVYDTLVHIAKEKKVSIAWVVRDAAERYIPDKWPLLKGQR